MFHELVKEQPLTRFSVSFDNFEKYLQYIQNKGIKTLSVSDLDKPLPGKATLLTFDDGHKSNIKAAELLSKYGMKGVFFIIKDFSLEKDDYMSGKDIQYIHSLGQMIGIHDKFHRHWTKMPEKELIVELIETKEWLENLIGEPVVICSAVGGKINERVYRIIESKLPTLKYIRSSSPWMNRYGDTRLHSTGIKYTSPDRDVFRRLNGDLSMYLYLHGFYQLKNLLRPVYSIILKR